MKYFIYRNGICQNIYILYPNGKIMKTFKSVKSEMEIFPPEKDIIKYDIKDNTLKECDSFNDAKETLSLYENIDFNI